MVAVEVLSDDYSKMVFLQCDRYRYIEFHAAHGRYYRLLRIPRFGYDMRYHLDFTSSEVYRLNLERGQFLVCSRRFKSNKRNRRAR